MALCCHPSLFAQSFTQADYVEGEFMVLLHEKVDAAQWCEELGAVSGVKFAPKQRLAQTMNLWLVSFDPQQADTREAMYLADRTEESIITQLNHNNLVLRSFPDDALFDEQWALYNDGTNGGTGTADIDATLAWDITTGGATLRGDSIVVAVIDGGFDLAHEDLVDNWFVNEAEIPGNNVDDDGNGFTDDVTGWNFYINGPELPLDAHGTHVAGTVGAKGNNGIGVTGVNWDVKLLPIAGSSNIESTVIAAYGYVLDMRRAYNQSGGLQGAFIVATNSSFGVDDGSPGDYPLWCAMYDSLGQQGILSAGATVNSYVDVDIIGDIPTTCPSDFLIAVTNTTASDYISSAGYGKINIDIGAPGNKIYSTTGNDSYGFNGGTSMATPHVSGAIALMYSALCTRVLEAYKYDPAGLALYMRQKLLKGVDKVNDLEDLVATGGRLNLYRAIESLPDTCLSVTIAATQSSCGSCNGSIHAIPHGAVEPVTYTWSNTPGDTSAQGNLCPGVYFLTIVDALGDSAFAYSTVSDVGGPMLDIDITMPSCHGYTDGAIDVWGGFSYTWSDGATTTTRSGIGAGLYFLTATNQSGPCVTVEAIEVNEPAEFHAVYDFILPQPEDSSNGVLSVSIFGGTPPYSYNWSNSSIASTITGLGEGQYFLTVTDANGCVFTDTAKLGYPSGVVSREPMPGISVFPNPVSDELTIRAGSGISYLAVHDMQGRLVLSQPCNAAAEQRINTSLFESGFYVVKITTEQGIFRSTFQVLNDR